MWAPDKEAEARQVFGTTDDTHPGVNYLVHRAGPVYIGGRVRGIEPPTFYDFKLLRDKAEIWRSEVFRDVDFEELDPVSGRETALTQAFGPFRVAT